MAFSEAWYDDYMEQYRQAMEVEPYPDDDPEVPDTGPEKKLQAKCLKYCKEHGWPCFHDYSKKKNQPGWPDLIIFMDDGRIEMVELKAAAGKLRSEQQQLHRNLMFLGHSIRTVKSYKRFKQIMEGRE